MSEVKAIKIDVDTTGAVASTENLVQATKDVGSEMKKSSASIEEVGQNVGKLNPAFGNAISGAKGLLGQFKLLMSNPIVLVVAGLAAALTALYKAFTSTKAGGEQLEQFMAGLGAIMDVIRDRILAVGETITKFFKGDFKGALDAAKKAVSGFGSEVAKEFSKAAQATKVLQRVDDEFRKLGVSRAKLNRDLAATKEIITDENASLAEKRKALDEVRKAEEKQTQAELKNAAKKLEAIKAKNALSDTSKADLQKEADAEAELFRLQEESARNNRTFNKQERILRKEAEAEQKQQHQDRLARMKEEQQAREEALAKIAKAENDARKYAAEKENEFYNTIEEIASRNYENTLSQQDQEIRAAEAKYFELETRAQGNADALREIEIAKLNEINDINLKYQDIAYKQQADAMSKEKEAKAKADSDKIEAEKAVAATMAAVREADFNNISAGINLVKNLFENNKKVQAAALIAENAVGIAKTIIATKAANQAARAQGTALAITSGGASTLAAEALILRNNIGAGISIAAQIAATAKGLSALKAGGSPSGSGGLSEGGSGSGGVTPNFNVVGNSGMNQLAQIQQTPMQAYVVSGEVTSAQALDRNRIKNATL